MLTTPLGRFRVVAFLEGLSYVVLLFVAMPLKYLLDMPGAVRAVGSAHGLLFVLYVLSLLETWLSVGWSFKRATIAFIACMVPFGTFWFEAQIRKELAAAAAPRPERA